MANLMGSFVEIFAVGSEKKAAAHNNELSILNAKIGNENTLYENAYEAAKNGLARFMQSLNNNRALKAGGDALEANTVNFLRSSDMNTLRGMAVDEHNMETLGKVQANAALAGIDGNVVDSINLSTNLRNQIAKGAAESVKNQATYDTARRAGNIEQQVVGGLDSSIILDKFNPNVAYSMEQPMPKRTPYVLDFIGQAVAAYFSSGATASQDLGVLGDMQDAAMKRSQQQFRSAELERQKSTIPQEKDVSFGTDNSNYDAFDYGSYDPYASAGELDTAFAESGSADVGMADGGDFSFNFSFE
jgi:hypothetical protein